MLYNDSNIKSKGFLFWKPCVLQNDSYVSGPPSMLETLGAVK